MKVVVTGFNPYGAIETKTYIVNKLEPVPTDLMPLSISVHTETECGAIRFDYETVESEDSDD